MSTRRSGVVGLGLVIVLMSWLIAGVATHTRFDPGGQSYAAPMDSSQWISPADGGRRAWFRDSFAVPAWATSVVVWFDTPGTANVYVDGGAVPLTYPGHVDNLPEAATGRPLVDAVDLSSKVATGPNSLVLEIASGDHTNARVRAQIALAGGGHSEALQTSAGPGSTWRVTSNAALLNLSTTPTQAAQIGLDSLTFSSVAFPDPGWTSPASATSKGASRSLVPQDAFDAPAPSFGVQSSLTDAVFRRPLVFDGSVPSWVWLRVWTNAPFTVAINGTLLTHSPMGSSAQVPTPANAAAVAQANSTPALARPQSTQASNLLDIKPWLHSGTNQLTVHVTGATISTSILGDVVAPGSDTSLASTGWSVVDPWQRPGAGVVASAATLYGVRIGANLPARPSPIDSIVQHVTPQAIYAIPGRDRYGLRFVIAGLLALLCVGCLLLGQVRQGRSALRTCSLTIVALAPATALAFLAQQLSLWADAIPPWPYTTSLVVIEAAVVLLGLGVVIVAALRTTRMPRLTKRAMESAVEADRRQELSISRSPRRRRLTSPTAAIIAIAVITTGIAAYRLAYEPYWQDELASLAAAQGIRAHILPQWPSGFLYFKSELYSSLIAAISSVFGNGPIPLRLPSVLLHGATVVLFGLKLLPYVIKQRAWLRVLVTAVFAIAPIEMEEARDLRMYQLAQFMAVVLIIVLLRTARDPTPKRVWACAGLAVGMYLAHEETFSLLPAIPIILFAETGWRWLREKMWLVPCFCAGSVILGQLALAKLTHPPAFGQDASFTPFLRWQPDVFYYLDYLTRSGTTAAPFLSVTLLALVGIAFGLKRRDRARIYFALLVVIPLVTLSLVLPAKEPRYVFITLPFLFALAGAAADDIVTGWLAIRAVFFRNLRTRLVSSMAIALALAGIVVSLGSGVADYGVAIGNAADVSVPLQHSDFDYAGAAIRSQIAPQDIIIAAAPANLVGQYFGRVPNYWLPNRPGSRMLYLIEKNNRVVDTQYGIPVLFSADDLENVLASGHRVWVVITSTLIAAQRDVLARYFQLVEDSNAVMVYRSVGT
jgi:hypothetical protein